MAVCTASALSTAPGMPASRRRKAASSSGWIQEREALMAEWGVFGLSGLVLAS
jgi:hypothetical protein